MTPRRLRAQYRAARTLERAERDRDRLDTRHRIALAVLADALADSAETRVPGYHVSRGPDGIRVRPLPPTDARQLELWRAMNAEENAA